MAISFSRPDPSSPTAVAEANFGTARRGFDQQEVRDFLRMVAAELARLQERERFLERELRAAQTRPPVAGEAPAIDEETVTRLLGEETARILTIARESATHIKERAEDGAARLLRESTEEANRQREESEVEAARRRSDAAADAEAELAMAKQQGREMVEEARAYRERVLSELARRRELARQQIDQLIHGRDRLVQAFERARLVAADVVSELAPLQEPDEYVDLTPTTGPVPLTVPAGQLGDRSAVGDVRMPGELAFDDDDDNPFVTDATGPTLRSVEPAEQTDGPHSALDDPMSEQPMVEGPEATDDAADDVAEVALVVVTEEVTTATIVPFPGPADAAPEEDPGDVAEAAPGADAPDASIAADDDDVTAADVDDLFARLRAGQPATDTVAGESGEVDDTGTDAEETPFAAREAVLVPLIVAGARKLKRRLADEQNEVLDALRRKEPVRSLDVLVPWESEQSERYTDAIAAELVGAVQAGAASIGAGAELDLGPTGILAPTRDAIAADLVVPLRERLARAVDDADGDNDAVAKKVRGIYREWKTQRIDEQLDDLFRGLYARAAFEAVAPGTRVRWLVDPDGPASPDCEDNSLAEPQIAGDAFPTGHACPPAHPGCRCLLSIADG